MIKYRASIYSFLDGYISKVEITKQTAKKVFYETKDYQGKPVPQQDFIIAHDKAFFDTYDEAKAWLMTYAERSIQNAEQEWQRSKSLKQTINNLKRID
jgi:hypothetical protein